MHSWKTFQIRELSGNESMIEIILGLQYTILLLSVAANLLMLAFIS